MAPSAASTAWRPDSCWRTQPASVMGATYTNPTFRGTAAGADGACARDEKGEIKQQAAASAAARFLYMVVLYMAPGMEKAGASGQRRGWGL